MTGTFTRLVDKIIPGHAEKKQAYEARQERERQRWEGGSKSGEKGASIQSKRTPYVPQNAASGFLASASPRHIKKANEVLR